MDINEFKSTAIAILRTTVGWQAAIARKLDVDSRTVRRWLKEEAVPDWVPQRLTELAGGADRSPWPRDEWVIGDAPGGDGKRREYIVHIQVPRFIARVVALDDDGLALEEELPADIMTGMVYDANETTVLCEIDWIDPVKQGEHVKWLEAASDALEQVSDLDGLE